MTDKIKITIMGCGGSGGVPYAGNHWGVCDPNEPKNARLRPSIMVQKKDTTIIVDTGPEFRIQLNRTGFKGVPDAVLYTHAHFDHIMGIDDLRTLWFRNNKQRIPVYASDTTAEFLKRKFDYIFETLTPEYPAIVEHKLLERSFNINDINIKSFEQIHGEIPTSGFRFNDFAYSTDVHELPEESLKALEGIKVWVVGVYPDAPGRYNHAGMDTLNKWLDRIQPQQVYLTHLTAQADYKTLCDTLPQHIRPAYDGLVIEV